MPTLTQSARDAFHHPVFLIALVVAFGILAALSTFAAGSRSEGNGTLQVSANRNLNGKMQQLENIEIIYRCKSPGQPAQNGTVKTKQGTAQLAVKDKSSCVVSINPPVGLKLKQGAKNPVTIAVIRNKTASVQFQFEDKTTKR